MSQLHDLLIIDDVFPCELSPFRKEEFSKILTRIQDTMIYTTGKSVGLLEDNLNIESTLDDYKKENEDFATRVKLWNSSEWDDSHRFRLAYVVFLNNAFDVLELLEEKKIPFVLELYPGGGFGIDNAESDRKLKRVLGSPCFRKVIVTQAATYEYLLRKGWCNENEIVDIFGVVIPESLLLNAVLPVRPTGSHNFVLTFCAFKYSTEGLDKGYDIFIQLAKKLHFRFPEFRFVVIGNFSRDDIDVCELGDSIEFKGVLSEHDMLTVFSHTDIIVAPNRANVLEPGFFDGFPTASCVSAALNGALVMTTDPLALNRERFLSGIDIEVLPESVDAFFERIAYYQANRKEFLKIRKRQLVKMIKTYSQDAQITPRIVTLTSEIARYSVEAKHDKCLNTQKVIIPIMHCFDNNYVIPAAASFYSMLKYADPQYQYRLYVLHTDITIQNQEMLNNIVAQFHNASLTFVNMENRFEDIWEQLNFSGHFSKEVLYKLLVASIFPQYDKIIITDVDVVFCGDIAPSYIEMNENLPVCFAGVRQICPKGTWLDSYYDNYKVHFNKDARAQLKVCGGYLVANLRYLRESKREEKFLRYLSANAYRLLQSEQDVINFCCDDSEIAYLPLNNVVCSYMYDIFKPGIEYPEDPFYSEEEISNAMKQPIQLHYATGTKPWNELLSTKADIWVRYIAEAGVFPQYMRKKIATQTHNQDYVDFRNIWPEWIPNNSPMTVSVVCCTYNHETFIREALEGIVNQEVDFPIEVIVADDASTDRTPEIISEYAEKYPTLFKCILRQENVGIGENYYDALCHVRGKYLAICDGDDCWVDSKKLKKQVAFLEKHPKCSICGTSFTRRINSEEGQRDEPFDVKHYATNICGAKTEYTFNDLVQCRFLASCTVMIRWQMLDRVPEFLRYYRIIDFPIELIHAAVGTIGLLGDYVSAIYNVHENGISSSASGDSMRQESLTVLAEIDQYLGYQFTDSITAFLKSAKNGKKNVVNETDGDVERVQPAHTSVQIGKIPLKQRAYAFFWRIYTSKYMPESIRELWRRSKRK